MGRYPSSSAIPTPQRCTAGDRMNHRLWELQLSKVTLDREPLLLVTQILSGQVRTNKKKNQVAQKPSLPGHPSHTPPLRKTLSSKESSGPRLQLLSWYRPINRVSTNQKSFSKLKLLIALTSVWPKSYCQINDSQRKGGVFKPAEQQPFTPHPHSTNPPCWESPQM